MKKLVVKVSTYDDWYHKQADYAVVELNTQAVERIKSLASAVRNLNVYKIARSDFSCDFKVVDWCSEQENGKVALDEFDGSMEDELLNVTSNEFFWSGVYKHTNIRWKTTSVPLSVLDEPGDFDEVETVNTSCKAAS